MVRREHLLLVIAGCFLAVTFQADASRLECQELPDPYKNPGSYLVMNLRRADVMVEGTVIAVNDSVSTEEGFDPATRTPGELYTFVTLQVDSVLKGDHNAPTLTFWYWGGRRWGHRTFTTFSSEFVVGRTVVVFLYSRELTLPLAEGLRSPQYQFKGKSQHYVVRDGSVYRADDLRRAIWREERGESGFGAQPVFSLESMFALAGEYLRSTSIESLAVKADVIAIGEVIARHVAVDDRGRSYEVIVFGNGSIVKGETSHMPLEIRSAGIGEPSFGRLYDKAVFPDNERILVFLKRQTDGVYRPLSTCEAARVLSNEAEERAAVQRISAVVGY